MQHVASDPAVQRIVRPEGAPARSAPSTQKSGAFEGMLNSAQETPRAAQAECPARSQTAQPSDPAKDTLSADRTISTKPATTPDTRQAKNGQSPDAGQPASEGTPAVGTTAGTTQVALTDPFGLIVAATYEGNIDADASEKAGTGVAPTPIMTAPAPSADASADADVAPAPDPAATISVDASAVVAVAIAPPAPAPTNTPDAKSAVDPTVIAPATITAARPQTLAARSDVDPTQQPAATDAKAKPQVASDGAMPQVAANGAKPQVAADGAKPQVAADGAEPQVAFDAAKSQPAVETAEAQPAIETVEAAAAADTVGTAAATNTKASTEAAPAAKAAVASVLPERSAKAEPSEKADVPSHKAEMGKAKAEHAARVDGEHKPAADAPKAADATDTDAKASALHQPRVAPEHLTPRPAFNETHVDAPAAPVTSAQLTLNTPMIPPHLAINASPLAAMSPVVALQADNSSNAIPVAGLAVEIVARASEGSKRFEIRLDPPELGRIDVRLDVDTNGKVTSRLMVERSETLDLLKRDAPQLERALQHAGLNTEGGMQFSLRDQSFANQQQDQMQRHAPATRLIVPDEEITVSEAARRGYGRMLGLGSGVDIRV